jgi:hypothetical protein
MADAPVSVVEMPQFLTATRTLLTDDDRGELVDFFGTQPLRR